MFSHIFNKAMFSDFRGFIFLIVLLVGSRRQSDCYKQISFNANDMKLWKTTHLSSQGFPKILVRKDISTNLLTASHISNCIIQQC